MSIKQANFAITIFTPCFTLVAGVFIGMIAEGQKHIDEVEYYCHPIPEIMANAKICKPRNDP